MNTTVDFHSVELFLSFVATIIVLWEGSKFTVHQVVKLGLLIFADEEEEFSADDPSGFSSDDPPYEYTDEDWYAQFNEMTEAEQMAVWQSNPNCDSREYCTTCVHFPMCIDVGADFCWGSSFCKHLA